MDWITNIFENFFGNDSKYFLLGAWLTALFMIIGQFWSLIGTAFAVGFLYLAEKRLYNEMATRDFYCVILGSLTSIIIGILFLP